MSLQSYIGNLVVKHCSLLVQFKHDVAQALVGGLGLLLLPARQLHDLLVLRSDCINSLLEVAFICGTLDETKRDSCARN